METGWAGCLPSGSLLANCLCAVLPLIFISLFPVNPLNLGGGYFENFPSVPVQGLQSESMLKMYIAMRSIKVQTHPTVTDLSDCNRDMSKKGQEAQHCLGHLLLFLLCPFFFILVSDFLLPSVVPISPNPFSPPLSLIFKIRLVSCFKLLCSPVPTSVHHPLFFR